MLIELSKQIKVIRPEVPAIFPYSNSVYINDEVKTLIDAGAGGRAYQDIPAEKIKLLLLSHYHFDHINGLSFFPAAEVMAGNEESWAYSDEQKYSFASASHRWEELMGVKKDENLKRFTELPDDIPSKTGFKQIQLNGLFKDGDIFELGETTVRAIHTPGHSSGHYAFFFEKEEILFSGDIDISPRGPWYGGEYSDFDDLLLSVEKLRALKAKILVTSHRHIFYEGIDNHLQEFIDIALEKERKILKFLKRPHSLNDIAEQDFVYMSEERSPHTVFWTKMMILKHLNSLLKRNRIKKINDERYIKVKEE